MAEKQLVIDTNVWLQIDNRQNLKKISENGCRIYIPQAVLEEVRWISQAVKNGTAYNHISTDVFSLLLESLSSGKSIPISTNKTGIVSQLKTQLEEEGIELKEPLQEGDVYEEPDINDLRILAAAVYLKRKAAEEGADCSIYLLTHDRWLAQFAVRCGIDVLGVKVWDGWAKKQPIPWKNLMSEN